MPANKRARGGEARAAALTPSERTEIARKGAMARWDDSIPSVEYGSDDRPLRIGGMELACYVLDDQPHTRVFSQRGMLEALGLGIRGGSLDHFIKEADLSNSLPEDALLALRSPLSFRPPGGGRTGFGYPVTLLVDLCNAILEARYKWPLPRRYRNTEIRAETIIKAVAKTGIIALVDEATGYDERRKETLEAILNAYLRAELATWSKRFPDEFYEEIFRLRGWPWRGRHFNPPGVVAHYTKDLVYARLAPDILQELEQRNPVVGSRRVAKHHQHLTDEIGYPALEKHLYTVIKFMEVADTWDDLMRMMDRALPRLDEAIQLDLLEWAKTAGLTE
jgi:hypothetical protein